MSNATAAPGRWQFPGESVELVVRRDGREPTGPGAAIGVLVTARA